MLDIEIWTTFAHDLGQACLDLFGASEVKVTAEGAADLKVLGLLLLARTLSNLRCTLIMLEAGRIVEARTLARMLAHPRSAASRE